MHGALLLTTTKQVHLVVFSARTSFVAGDGLRCVRVGNAGIAVINQPAMSVSKQIDRCNDAD